MNNKERYKQAFSALQTSGQLSMEVEKMREIQKKHKRNMIAAAAVACTIIIGGSGTAYAADIGGIQEKVSIWLYGAQTEADIMENGDGGYTVRYERDGEEQGVTAFGGVSIDDDGTQTWLSADELVDAMNESADVDEDADGRVWVYYYDQKVDVTDLFDDEGICRVSMTHEGQVIYLEIEREEYDGYVSYPYSQTNDLPEEEIEKYTDITPK